MTISRRDFVKGTVAASGLTGLGVNQSQALDLGDVRLTLPTTGARRDELLRSQRDER